MYKRLKKKNPLSPLTCPTYDIYLFLLFLISYFFRLFSISVLYTTIVVFVFLFNFIIYFALDVKQINTTTKKSLIFLHLFYSLLTFSLSLSLPISLNHGLIPISHFASRTYSLATKVLSFFLLITCCLH